MKKIKIKDIINFLYSDENRYKEFLLLFENQKKELKYLITYIFEYTWRYPKLIEYLNKYNTIYFNEDPIEFLIWLRYIIQNNKINLESKFFNYSEAIEKVKKLEEEAIKTKRQIQDIKAELILANIKNQKINIHQNKKIEKNNEIKKKIKNQYQEIKSKEIEKIEQENQQRTQSRILNEINENIIKELELTLIDIYTDKKNNKLIYIFLDKNFKKKYYIADFKINFYISKDTNIINNDYLEILDEKKFIKYSIFNFWDFNKLKSAIVKNYEKNIKLDF